jgi:hypothetical protein
MSELLRSTTAVNRIRSFIQDRSLSVEQVAQEAGLDSDLLRELTDDAHRLPDMVLLDALWRT